MGVDSRVGGNDIFYFQNKEKALAVSGKNSSNDIELLKKVISAHVGRGSLIME